VSDSYYELIDDGDALGERFVATDLVRSTRSAPLLDERGHALDPVNEIAEQIVGFPELDPPQGEAPACRGASL
jgi:hypothetical protein